MKSVVCVAFYRLARQRHALCCWPEPLGQRRKPGRRKPADWKGVGRSRLPSTTAQRVIRWASHSFRCLRFRVEGPWWSPRPIQCSFRPFEGMAMGCGAPRAGKRIGRFRSPSLRQTGCWPRRRQSRRRLRWEQTPIHLRFPPPRWYSFRRTVDRRSPDVRLLLVSGSNEWRLPGAFASRSWDNRRARGLRMCNALDIARRS